MPNEIQVHILCYLDTCDILSLRLTSKSLFQLLQLNASAISPVVLRRSSLGDNHVFLDKLYQPSIPIHNLDYFLQMMHRERVVLRMVSVIADFVQFKIYQAKSTSRRKQFAPCRARMERKLKAPTFIIYHFLEKFRASLLRRSETASSNGQGSSTEARSIENEMQAGIIKSYPGDILLPAFQLYRVLVSAYRQKLRPPTYAGTIERKLRGWDRTPATDADVGQVLVYGGMEEVLKVMLCPTYDARLRALSAALDRIKEPSSLADHEGVQQKSKPKVTQELDIPHITNIQFMSQGSNTKLTTLYLPWLSAIVAKQRAAEPDPHIPSPFSYIEDVLQDPDPETSGETGRTLEGYTSRVNNPDEDEENADEAPAGNNDANPAVASQHYAWSFPSQYG